ncbi:MAG: hypothetical protein EDM05_013935 [Leptolyngbya sp. IPPAS B-1204]|nr:hypothetical protein [Elainella sp. C42_A2020_010]RNJ65681.1 MAG: hypothetical protein EDM05_29845 [Leptolyngbya sp. IPPAS B-1204]
MKLNGLAAVSVMVLLGVAQELGARRQKSEGGVMALSLVPQQMQPQLLQAHPAQAQSTVSQGAPPPVQLQIPIHPSTVRLSRSRRSPSTPTAA